MKQSAGIVLYRFRNHQLQVLIVHPGGPLWAKKDLGAWSIPKGEFTADEEPLAAAKREFFEETGVEVSGEFLPLSPIRQKGGKMVIPFALESDLDSSKIRSNTFEMEWPPHSGKQQSFPEIDRAEWVDIPVARQKLNPAQVAIVNELDARC